MNKIIFKNVPHMIHKEQPHILELLLSEQTTDWRHHQHL